MSERGTFVAQFIYCPQCREKILAALGASEDIGSLMEAGGLIAGRITGSWRGEELYTMQYEIFNAENAPCDDVVIAVIADNGQRDFFTVHPDGRVTDGKGRDPWRV